MRTKFPHKKAIFLSIFFDKKQAKMCLLRREIFVLFAFDKEFAKMCRTKVQIVFYEKGEKIFVHSSGETLLS
jgi:hypothetical protein